MRIFLLYLLLLCLSVTPIFSQNESNDSNDDWEVWRNSIPASTGIKVGIMDAVVVEKINPKIIYVNLPEIPTSDLCIEVSSKDGRYKAERIFQKETLTKGVNPIKWPTKFGKKLVEFSSSDVVILARLADSCQDDPDYMVASSWAPTFTSENVILYLRSSDPPSILFSNENDEIVDRIKCKSIEKQPTVSYDCECSIPQSLLTQNYSTLILKKTKRNGRTKTKKYPIKIKF